MKKLKNVAIFKQPTKKTQNPETNKREERTTLSFFEVKSSNCKNKNRNITSTRERERERGEQVANKRAPLTSSSTSNNQASKEKERELKRREGRN